MNCKNCGNNLPTKRIELGFKQCVDCSTVETYGTVDIVYHKTGNCVQHVDKETAAHINKIARRPGFGSSLGRIGKGGHTEFSRKLEHGCSTSSVGVTEAGFNRIGEEAMEKLDILGLDKAIQFVKRKHESALITTQQYNKLVSALVEFSKVS